MNVVGTADTVTICGLVAATEMLPPPYRGGFYDFKGRLRRCAHAHSTTEEAHLCAGQLLEAFRRKHRSWTKRARRGLL